MNKSTKSPLMKKAPTYSLRASIISILIGLLTGAVVILIVGAFNPLISLKGAWDGIRLVLFGVLGTGRDAAGALTFGFNPTNIGNMLFRATPLILTGVSVAVAFKTGLFNIGAAGQYVAGAGAALYLALALNQPWYVCVIGAMLAGAMLGAISGALKSYCNVNEVISGIMLNWISLYVVNMILTTVKETTSPYTVTISSTNPAALIPSLGLGKLFSNNQYVTIALPIAILVSILIWVLLEKTKFGYELRATGSNKNAAKYCGMNEKRNIILTMVIAGALAGLGAALLFLTGFEQWQCSQSSVPTMGFNGIAAAFLGGLNPIGNIFSSYFIQHITNGGAYVDKTMYCAQISDLISSIIIYLCGFVAFFKYFINNCIDRSEERKAHKKAAEDAAEKAGAIKEGGNK